MRNISVVITLLNEIQTVGQLLDALSKQTILPTEVIVVDGGSSDGTYEWLSQQVDRYSDFFHLRVFQKKGNRSVGRNYGFNQATSDWIAVTDAGCVPQTDWIQQLIEARKGEEVCVVAGVTRADFQNTFEEAQAVYVLPKKITEGEYLPATRSLLIHKSIWKSVGQFDEKLSDNEDYAFALRVRAADWPIKVATGAVVLWRPRESLLSFGWMLFRFARGDIFAGIVRARVIALFIRYGVAVGLVGFAAASGNSYLWFLCGVFLLLYAVWSVTKHAAHISVKAWLWVPVLQLLADVSVMSGSISGMVQYFSMNIKRFLPLFLILILLVFGGVGIIWASYTPQEIREGYSSLVQSISTQANSTKTSIKKTIYSWVPGWNKPGKEVLDEFIKTLKTADRYEMNSNIILTATTTKGKEVFSTDLNFTIATQQVENGKFKFFELLYPSESLQTSDLDSPFSVLDVYESIKLRYQLGGTFKMTGFKVEFDVSSLWDAKDIYFKIDKIPSVFPVQPRLKGTWIQMPPDIVKEMKQALRNTGEQKSRDADTVSLQIFGDQYLQSIESYKKMMDAAQYEMAYLEEYQGHEVWVVTQVIPKEALQLYIQEAASQQAEIASAQDTLSPAEKEKVDEMLAEVLKAYSSGMGEMRSIYYIDSTTYEMRGGKVSFTFSFQPLITVLKKELTPRQLEGLKAQGGAPADFLDLDLLKMESSFTSTTKGEDVTAPSDYATFDELGLDKPKPRNQGTNDGLYTLDLE